MEEPGLVGKSHAKTRGEKRNSRQDLPATLRVTSWAGLREALRAGLGVSLFSFAPGVDVLIRSAHIHGRTRLEIRIGGRFRDRLTKLFDGRQSTGLFAAKLDQAAIRTV